MMFLSQLMVNPRNRQARNDLGNVYELHRTLCRAFPDAKDGGIGRILFRIEAAGEEGPVVLVQSEKSPDWSRLGPEYLSAPPGLPKRLDDLRFSANQVLRFRLRANPTRRISRQDDPLAGKRVELVREPELIEWLGRKAHHSGFRVRDVLVVPEGKLTARKAGQRLTYASVRFDGLLEVSDPTAFLTALAVGIGSAKAFGFGLLSVARA
jgi:CRISPR system Cascade subunit CasE